MFCQRGNPGKESEVMTLSLMMAGMTVSAYADPEQGESSVSSLFTLSAEPTDYSELKTENVKLGYYEGNVVRPVSDTPVQCVVLPAGGKLSIDAEADVTYQVRVKEHVLDGAGEYYVGSYDAVLGSDNVLTKDGTIVFSRDIKDSGDTKLKGKISFGLPLDLSKQHYEDYRNLLYEIRIYASKDSDTSTKESAVLYQESLFCQPRHRCVVERVRIKGIDTVCGPELEKAPYLLFVVAVSAPDLSSVGIHLRRHQPNPQPFGDRTEQELGRGGNDHIVVPLLFQIPGFKIAAVLFPEVGNNGIHAVHPVQKGKERLLQVLGILSPSDEIRYGFQRRGRQSLQHGARVMPQAEQDEADGAVRDKDRVVKVVDVHTLSPCLFSIVRLVSA